MPIKPIDMQIMMPRVNEVSRIQNNEQQHSLATLQNKVQTNEKQLENSIRQVNSREEDEKKILIDKHQKNKQSNKKDSSEKHEENEEKENKKLSDVNKTGRTIDIRL